ncbi:MAG: ribose/xylose/arabinose/galactoside ABC-type transport system permease subunit [Parasphingorhabdus sp.]|jgi:ribose/xylose/arabinose/galactoside ABC-type transport system permease subunit
MTQQTLSPLAKSRRVAAILFIKGGVLPWFLGIAVVGFSISSENFLTERNLFGVSRQSTYLVLVAMAQMVVMLTAGLDLSVGVMLAMTSVVSSMTMVSLWSGYGSGWEAVFIGCLAGLGASVAIGVINGVGVAFFRVPPFVMTLAMSSVVFGLALTITGGTPIYGVPESFANIFGYGELAGIAVPVWITAFCVCVMYVFIHWTPMGRYLYAIGGNIRAAGLSGINTRLYLLSAYVISSIITGIAALLLTARLESGESNIGANYPLLSITACAIGGVSLFGGVGRLSNVVLGAIFIILIQNGMNLLRINSYLQMVVIGVLLVVAIVADNYRQKLMLTAGEQT